jgi:membrane protein YdbS with pleckstrin-like domain
MKKALHIAMGWIVASWLLTAALSKMPWPVFFGCMAGAVVTVIVWIFLWLFIAEHEWKEWRRDRDA